MRRTITTLNSRLTNRKSAYPTIFRNGYSFSQQQLSRTRRFLNTSSIVFEEDSTKKKKIPIEVIDDDKKDETDKNTPNVKNNKPEENDPTEMSPEEIGSAMDAEREFSDPELRKLKANQDPESEFDNIPSKTGPGVMETSADYKQEVLESSVSAKRGPPIYFPYAPIICTNRQGVFPEFLKIVTISDPTLISLIQQKIEQNLPYVVIAIKKDDNNMDDVVGSLEDIYEVGTLCQILEIKEYRVILRKCHENGRKWPKMAENG